MDEKNLQNLKNDRLSVFKEKISSSTNFFNKNEKQNQNQKKVFYEFEHEESSNNKKKLNAVFTENEIVKKIKHPVKKHGIKVYSIFIIFIAVFIALVSVIFVYSFRYGIIAKNFSECEKSISVIQSNKLIPYPHNCENYSKSLWSGEYWKNGLNPETLNNKNKEVIKQNQDIYNNAQIQWLTLSKNLQQEFAIFKSSNEANLTIEQILPQDSLLIGEKISNGLIQLKIYQEKNSETATNIISVEKQFQNKIDLYSKIMNLEKYNVFLADYMKKNDDEKLASFFELKKLNEELKIFTETNLKNLDNNSASAILEALKKEYKTFTSNQFYQLENELSYKFVSDFAQNPAITGDAAADKYIESVAVARGYQKRNIAYENRLEVIDGEYLQPEARESFERLKLAAEKDGISLVLVSGYRSVVEQKNLFNSRFVPFFSATQILNKEADSTLEQVLSTSSIPGYSKHHTGYAFDLGCSDRNITLFANTKCYQWISANNFLNAKRFGLIPSYPDGVSVKQGPNPEPWEFVWVGQEKLKAYSANSSTDAAGNTAKNAG